MHFESFLAKSYFQLLLLWPTTRFSLPSPSALQLALQMRRRHIVTRVIAFSRSATHGWQSCLSFPSAKLFKFSLNKAVLPLRTTAVGVS